MGKHLLTEDAVRDMLTSGESLRALGKRWGCHPSTVGYVRTGKINRDIAPEIPRWYPDLICDNCLHWTGACGLDFPDPQEEGVKFARECSSFINKHEAKSISNPGELY